MGLGGSGGSGVSGGSGFSAVYRVRESMECRAVMEFDDIGVSAFIL